MASEDIDGQAKLGPNNDIHFHLESSTSVKKHNEESSDRETPCPTDSESEISQPINKQKDSAASADHSHTAIDIDTVGVAALNSPTGAAAALFDVPTFPVSIQLSSLLTHSPASRPNHHSRLRPSSKQRMQSKAAAAPVSVEAPKTDKAMIIKDEDFAEILWRDFSPSFQVCLLIPVLMGLIEVLSIFLQVVLLATVISRISDGPTTLSDLLDDVYLRLALGFLLAANVLYPILYAIGSYLRWRIIEQAFCKLFADYMHAAFHTEKRGENNGAGTGEDILQSPNYEQILAFYDTSRECIEGYVNYRMAFTHRVTIATVALIALFPVNWLYALISLPLLGTVILGFVVYGIVLRRREAAIKLLQSYVHGTLRQHCQYYKSIWASQRVAQQRQRFLDQLATYERTRLRHLASPVNVNAYLLSATGQVFTAAIVPAIAFIYLPSYDNMSGAELWMASAFGMSVSINLLQAGWDYGQAFHMLHKVNDALKTKLQHAPNTQPSAAPSTAALTHSTDTNVASSPNGVVVSASAETAALANLSPPPVPTSLVPSASLSPPAKSVSKTARLSIHLDMNSWREEEGSLAHYHQHRQATFLGSRMSFTRWSLGEEKEPLTSTEGIVLVPAPAVRSLLSLQHVRLQFDERLAPVIQDTTLNLFEADTDDASHTNSGDAERDPEKHDELRSGRWKSVCLHEPTECQTIALVGPSGSGKSTLLEVLLGFHRITSGELRRAPRVQKRNICWVPPPNHVAVWSDQTLRENLLFDCHVRTAASGSSPRDAAAVAARIEEENEISTVVRLIGMEQHLQKTALGEHLSTGERQRVAIGRALLSRKACLMMDEGTSGLDEATEERLWPELCKRFAYILLVTHDWSAVKRCDRVVVMMGGCLVEDGDPTRLSQNNQSHVHRLFKSQFTV